MMGGTLFVCCTIAFWGFVAYQAVHVRHLAAEMTRASAFVNMIRVEEQMFLGAMSELAVVTPEGVEKATARLATLEACHKSLCREPAGEPLKTVLADYGKALNEWRLALELMREPDADLQVVQGLLAHGDELREKAATAFDARYVKK